MRVSKFIITTMLLLGSIHVPAMDQFPEIENPSQAIYIHDREISLDVHDILLGELIDELGRQAGFTIISYVQLNQLVTYKFNNVPLGIALKRLLRDHSHMIHFESQVNSGIDSSGLVKTLWILPQQGDAHSFSRKRRISGYDISGTKKNNQFMTGISNHDPVREDKIADLGQYDDSYALGELSQALADQDSDIRLAAIESLAERGDVSAVKALATALADADPDIREEAVYALGDIGGDEAIGLLKQALGDSEDFVREAAMDTLEDLQDE